MKSPLTLLTAFAAMMAGSNASAHESGASTLMHSLTHTEASAAIWTSVVVAVISGIILSIRKHR